DSATYTGSVLAYPSSDVTVTGGTGTLSFTYDGSTTVPITAGSYTVVATFKPTDTTDYNTVSATAVTWTINKASPTVSAINDSATYTGSALPYPSSDVTVTGAGA